MGVGCIFGFTEKGLSLIRAERPFFAVIWYISHIFLRKVYKSGKTILFLIGGNPPGRREKGGRSAAGRAARRVAEGQHDSSGGAPDEAVPRVAPPEEIELYPYGCAKLRMTELPMKNRQ